MSDSVIRRVLAAVALSWVAVLVFATSVAARSRAGGTASLVSLTTYALGSLVCHQRPERSFHFWGAQFPVCARCAGLYAGAALAAIVVAALRHRSHVDRVSRYAREVLGVAALPTVATLVYEFTTGDMPSNAIRCIAGLPLGAAVLWVIVSVSVSTSGRAVEIH